MWSVRPEPRSRLRETNKFRSDAQSQRSLLALDNVRNPNTGRVVNGAKAAQKFDRSAIDAVLFDMDGVVIDSEPVHERSLIVAAERMGHNMTRTEALQLRGMTQEASAAGLKALVPNSPMDAAQIIRIRAQVFNDHVADVRVMPNALEFIERLRDSGVLVALTTGSGGPGLKMIFDRFDLYRYFELVVTGDHVTHSKPHPEGYLLTMEHLCVGPDHCLVIEDSLNGIKSGTAAGCTAIGLTSTFPEKELIGAGADFCVESFEELERTIFPPSSADVN
jgi:HAD superfamily hydrolase (TIGR01509 family)